MCLLLRQADYSFKQKEVPTRTMSPITTQTQAKTGDLLLLIGTTKGAFLFRSNAARQRWQVSGPHFPGLMVYALAYDGRRGRTRIWAGTGHPFFGCSLHSSDDFGANWTNPEIPAPQFPADAGVSLKQIWQIVPGRPEEPDTLYCGVEPAALFESKDAGVTWSLVRGLFDHPHRPRWQPGAGGLCLHTILLDPKNPRRMHVAISAAGVYRTDDGGASWKPMNQGVRVDFAPIKYPEFGQCVHKIALHPARPARLLMQNHGGLYRSDNGGESWRDISKGVPSDFGFPMVLHPHKPETAYVMPLEAPIRCVPEAKLRVYRTRNGGRSWEPLSRGLPQKDAYETVLRDGMAADSLQPAGIYFGTHSGKLYGSRNEGTSWQLIRDGLPPIVCVKAAVVATAPVARKAVRAKTAAKGGKRPKRRAASRA